MAFTSPLSHSSFLFPLQNPSPNPLPTSMASLSIINHKNHHQQNPFLLSVDNPLRLRRRSLLSTKPIFSIPFKTPFPSLPISSSLESGDKLQISHSDKTPHPLFSLLKTPLCIAVTAAALFLSHLPNKPLIALADGGAAAPAVETRAGNESAAEAEEEREKILEEYLQENPSDVKALKALMEVKIKKQNLSEAIELVNRLAGLEPDELEWPLLRAHLYGHSGEHELAMKGFEEVLAREPLQVQAFHGLIMVAGQLDSESESDVELGKVMKRVDEAMQRCRREKKKHELRDFRLLVAQIRVIEGNYKEGLKVYEELVKEEPRDFRPYLCQGIIYTLLGKKEDADRNFEKYKRLMPKGHPYARYFDDNMMATKFFAQAAKEQQRAEAGVVKG
ncbi:hypothetical protein Dimus_034554 [Dionaea muscipula]